MCSLLRRYLGLSLVLILVVTSQAMAVARGAQGPSGVVELCTGSGPVMVAVDEAGTPVGVPHFCPDGALALLAHVALATQTPVIAWQVTELSGGLPEAQANPVSVLDRRARAPPVAG